MSDMHHQMQFRRSDFDGKKNTAVYEEVPFDYLLISSSHNVLQTAMNQIKSSQPADSPNAMVSFYKILLRLTGLPHSE